jgi:CheY-like chemotaxis protein
MSVDKAVISPKALVVDDDSLCLLTTKGIMERLGMETHVAPTPEEALKLGLASAYDYIVLDIEMPTLNGYELCRRLRATESKSKNAFIVALSGHIHNEHHVKECMKAGICDVLTKPVTVDQMHKRLDYWKFALRNAALLAVPLV